MERFIGRLLTATAIGHTLVGVAIFRKPLTAIVRDGFFNAVDLHFDRRAAFWFLLFSPALFMIGRISDRALERRDAKTLRIIGWNFLGMGSVGAAAMPVSGFWILVALAPLFLRAARTVETQAGSFSGTLDPEPTA